MDFMDNEVFEDDLHVVELIVVGIPRRVLRRNDLFFGFHELAFFKRFRLTKNTVRNLLIQLENRLEYPYDSNNCLSPISQLLIALRYYATGSHLQSVADFAGVDVSTACRTVKRVSLAIGALFPLYVKFPTTNEEKTQGQRNFFNIAAFPRVLGAVDGTHIRIQSPGGNDAEVFRNRKDYFSINVQAVSDANMKIIDLVVRWPGSSHDATIFNNSAIKGRFERGDIQNGLLLGDSAYPLKSYLMTPLLGPRTPAEQRYNEAQIRTRGVVEKLFGIWKRRFPVLAYGCRLKLPNVLVVIGATAVLHNIARDMGEQEPPVEGDVHQLDQLIADGQVPGIPAANWDPRLGRNVRDRLIAEYFEQM